MKFIVLKDPEQGLELPVIFPAVLSHDSVRVKFPQHEVLSAGHIKLDGSVEAFGKSTSLELPASPGDSKLINHWFQMEI